MPLISKPFLIRHSKIAIKSVPDSARRLREIAVKSLASDEGFDIFLSHAFVDADYILLLYDFLTEIGYTVFVDWIEAPQLDRSNVKKETADELRKAMRRSESLLFAVSSSSGNSKWMPWELGYSDALHGKVAVMPIRDMENAEEAYSGQEYLGLYPYITSNPNGEGQAQLWVNWSTDQCVSLTGWIRGEQAKKLSLFSKALRETTGELS